MFRAERQYFRVESGPAYEVLSQWRKDRQAIEKQCFDFAKSVGGSGFYAGHDDDVAV